MKYFIWSSVLSSILFFLIQLFPLQYSYETNTISSSRGKDVLSDSIIHKSSTIFLIDKSGSMALKGKSGKLKWEEAQEAALKATSSILKGNSEQQQVAFLTFSGGCVADPTHQQILKFSGDYKEVEQELKSLGRPGGGTPLHEAVIATKKRLQDYSSNYGDGDVSKLIVLSDGVATCGQVRPKDVYGTGVNIVDVGTKVAPIIKVKNTTKISTVKSKSFNGNTKQTSSFVANSTIPVKYFTIGFDIKAGSPAERDLQYLAAQSGGKYLNTQNEFELTRAFTKFFKVYYPKPYSSVTNLDFKTEHIFLTGVESIEAEAYRKAQELFETFCKAHPEDYNALFNLALMYEANDFHLQAIEKFEDYLLKQPNANDKAWVLEQIAQLQNDMLNFYDYTKALLQADLAYLELYFKKIQNGESLALAYEFIGFIKEKEFYFKDLPPKLGLEDKFKLKLCNTIQTGLDKCAKSIKRDPENWDRNATPQLSLVFFNLEKLINNL